MSDGYIAGYVPSTVRDWCAVNRAPYRVLLPARQEYTFSPCYGPEPGFGSTTMFNEPEAYIAEIPDCAVVGGYGVVFKDRAALFDGAFGERSARFEFSNPILPNVNREMVQVRLERVADEPIPEGVLLQSWFAANYHHWYVEHLPKLWLLELAEVPPNVPLLIDGSVTGVPQLLEVLRALTDRPVIPLDWAVGYRVGKLYVPSNLFGTGPNLRPGYEVETGDVTVAREAIAFLRSRIAAPDGHSGRRVYIDRRAKMAPIRLLNGDVVEKVFAEFGFETVRPGTMSFAEQRAVFGAAEYIAGESGAALTNVLLAPPSAIMVCLQAQRWPLNIYADLCAYGDQRSVFLVGTPEFNPTGQTYQAPFSYNPHTLRETLQGLLT